MNTVEQITTVRNMNAIQGTNLEFNLTERNDEMAGTIGRIDVTSLTSKEAKSLGFGVWSEETNLHLIPFYLYDFLAFGQELESISGDKVEVTPNYRLSGWPGYIDNDYRFGCLAYGFVPKD